MPRLPRSVLRFTCSLLFGAWFLNSAAPAQESTVTAKIQEWPVPWAQSRPRDPYVAPDGTVWFVGQGDDYAARFNPRDESFKRYELPPGTGPHNLIVSADGSVWYAGNRNAHIGHLNPADGHIDRYPTPEPAAKDPHTLTFAANGQIWFTAQWGNHIGRFTPADGRVETIKVPTERARPYGIALDSRGHPWVVLLGTNKLATIDPGTLALTEIALPRSAARPRRIAITADDQIWYVDYHEGYLGRYHPGTARFTEWRAPGAGRSGPYAMGADHQGRIWFVETWQQPNRLVGFDPVEERFFSLNDIPSGGGTVRHLYYDAAQHSLWFGTDTNYLARAQLP